MSLGGFLRAFRQGKGMDRVRPRAPDSLARTAKHALHNSRAAGNAATLSSERAYGLVAEGHENYAKSFEKKDEVR